MKAAICLAVMLALSGGAGAETVQFTPPAEGTVSAEQGLVAWARIYEVASHPRCANCHVGADHVPMWSGPSFARTRKHGMNVNGGESRMGAETVLCSSCHTASRAGQANKTPHAAPRVAGNWQLPPVEAEWFGKSSEEICAQLRDPERNGGRDHLGIAAHLDHDVVLHWAWAPGSGREPAPYSLQAHVDDVLIWGVAGMPCPQD